MLCCYVIIAIINYLHIFIYLLIYFIFTLMFIIFVFYRNFGLYLVGTTA
jgi:hypothetical protein